MPDQTEPSTAKSRIRPRWRWADLIDFEAFLRQDDEREEQELEERDRAIYREKIEPLNVGVGTREGRRLVLRIWLEERRKEVADASLLPGVLFGQSFQLVFKLLLLAGIIIGSGAAYGLMRYEGQQAVNVAAYFGVIVVFQIALVAGVLLLVLTGLHARLFPEFSLVRNLLAPLIRKLASWGHKEVFQRLPGADRNRMKAALGTVGTRNSLFGHLFYWPIFYLLQVFGVAFNAGVLAVTVLLVVFSDRAFGWQSAIQFSAETVHAAARTIAAPWSWTFPEGIGYPTVEQVEQSRIVLKEGLWRLTTEGLVSWWPFLVLSVFVYGFIPRLILAGYGFWAGRRGLNRLDFSHAECDRLIERMTVSHLVVAGEPDAGRAEQVASARAGWIKPEREEGESQAANESVVILPVEIRDQLDGETLGRALRRFGWELGGVIEIGHGWEEDQKRIVQAGERPPGQAAPKALIVQEAWQPPITEILQLIAQTRKLLGDRAKLIVGLVGKPHRKGGFAPVRDSDFQVWKTQIKTLADPYLRLEKLELDARQV